MPNRPLMTVKEFRRVVLGGLSPAALNEDLKIALRERCRETPVHEIVEALGSPARINLELIVDAAEYGRADMIEALVKAVPVEKAQDYFDRALIGVAVNDFATPQDYLRIAQVLIEHGADPEAYENTCRQLCGTSAAKEPLYTLFCDVIDAREAARDRMWQEEFKKQKSARPAR